MKNSRASRPEVNAGSMADIAFLLLIFFLVTTVIPNDQGINRKLPEICNGPDCIVDTHQRNIFQVLVNESNKIMVNNKVIALDELQKLAMDFIDNNGDRTCDYCSGNNLAIASDNPKKAIVSLKSHRESNYNTFIKVQDELSKVYKKLRLKYAKNVLGKSELDLSQEDIKLLKEAYPFVVSEAEITQL